MATDKPGESQKDGGTVRYVYSVMFYGAPFYDKSRQRVFFFSSLAAIFDIFTPEQIGCCLRHLYNLQVASGAAFAGKQCIIKRERLFSKRQKRR